MSRTNTILAGEIGISHNYFCGDIRALPVQRAINLHFRDNPTHRTDGPFINCDACQMIIVLAGIRAWDADKKAEAPAV